MDRRGFQGRQLIAAVGFVGTVVVLAVQLITPSPVMVSLGENGAEATQVGQYFTYTDVSLIVVSAILCGASGTWLLVGGTVLRGSSNTSTAQHDATGNHDTTDNHGTTTQHPTGDSDPPDIGSSDGTPPDPEPSPQDRWEQAVDRLRNNEETIYALLVKADGKLPQRELVKSTDLSKATISRTLDKLEQKELVERKRRGMGNVVHLK
ncbi:MarR family transcriptional regulator [Halorubrum sp. Atlit-26R]|uniref:helix-turn-helix transcriptional regulator n=1 Tax=Halorubrum sp. Atlit-26R TaxID=2282128 RepID=UPI000EF21061|nr:MarR family transcriptional regulator [Halorubrum sp. Atlit-26R]RLM63663.1 MarR family transcriptional regulator [Halorubrum sp. Atlit-26R]